MPERVCELALLLIHKVVVVRRIGELMKGAPVNGLRLGALRYGHDFERVFRGYVDVAPHEVDEVCAL